MASRLKIAQQKYCINDCDMSGLAKYSGKDHKYIDFACNAWTSSDVDDICEYEDIGNYIKIFEKYKSKLEQKDLNKYTVSSLKDAISKLELSRKDLKNKEVNILYEDDTWKVVHPTTFESSVLYSSNTKWCVSNGNTYKDYNIINFYKNSVTYNFLVIIINKLTNKKIGGSFFGNTTLGAHHIDLYDETDNLFFSLSGIAQTNYKKVLNNIFSNMCETKSQLVKEDFSKLVFQDHLLPFVQVNQNINEIYNKFISYLYDTIHEVKFNFNLSNNCYNLISNKNAILNKAYSLDSASKILEILNKHFKSEVADFSHIMKIHDNKCNFLESSKKVKSKVSKDIFDFKSLEQCSCDKFNNLEFLQALQKSVDKTVCDTKPLKEKKSNILSVVKNKIKFLEEFNKNRTKYMQTLLNKDSKNDNVDFLISKLKISRDEALFLQVKSESSKVKNYCKSTYKIPDDFAKEMLALKNINNLADIAKV